MTSEKKDIVGLVLQGLRAKEEISSKIERDDEKFFENSHKPGTVPRGNTKSRGWCLTFFNADQMEEFKEWSGDSRYALLGVKELTLEKKEHWHAFVYYTNPRSWKPIHEKFNGVHIEPVRKCINYMKYCCKEGKLWEDGDPPKQNIDVENMSVEEIVRADPRCFRPYLAAKDILEGIKKKNEMLNMMREGKCQGPKCIVYNGGTAKGKTYAAIRKAIELGYSNEDVGFIDFDNKFIYGEVRNKCLICKEFRPSAVFPPVLLELLDKYGMNARVLGSYVFVKPEVVLLCSIVPVKDFYKNHEIGKQFTRRVEIIDLGYSEEEKEEMEKMISRI